MLHPEKPYLPLVYRFFKIMQKVAYYWAYKIKPKAYYQLYMGNVYSE